MGTSGLGIHNSLTGVVLSWFFFNDTLATFLYDMKTCQNLLLPKAFFWRSNAQHKSPPRQEKFMKGCSSWTKPRQVELFLPFKVQVMHRIFHFTDNFYVLLFTYNRSWEVEKKYANSLIFFRHFTKKNCKYIS